MKKRTLASFFLLAALTGFTGSDSPRYFIRTSSAEDLHKLLRRTPDRIPLISAHRGGPAPGFPENCIPTFAHTLSRTHAAIEFDVQLSADDSLIVMHDDRLDRTSTGSGEVKDFTWAQLRKLQLKDDQENLTPYGIPTLSEVLHWAKGKTVLFLDSKRSVPPERMVRAVREAGAEAYTIVITYTPEKAAQIHRLHPQLMLSVNIYQLADFERLTALGVPTERMAAFTGVSENDPSLYRFLHDKGISCITGTMGNLDRKAEARGNQVYQDLIRNGSDILSTDQPEAVAEAYRPLLPEQSSKWRFFSR